MGRLFFRLSKLNKVNTGASLAPPPHCRHGLRSGASAELHQAMQAQASSPPALHRTPSTRSTRSTPGSSGGGARGSGKRAAAASSPASPLAAAGAASPPCAAQQHEASASAGAAAAAEDFLYDLYAVVCHRGNFQVRGSSGACLHCMPPGECCALLTCRAGVVFRKACGAHSMLCCAACRTDRAGTMWRTCAVATGGGTSVMMPGWWAWTRRWCARWVARPLMLHRPSHRALVLWCLGLGRGLHASGLQATRLSGPWVLPKVGH